MLTFFTATLSDGFVLESIPPFFLTSLSHSSRNGGCVRATLAGLLNTTTLSELVSILERHSGPLTNQVMQPSTEALKSWCSSSHLRCKALVGPLTCSLHGGAQTNQVIMTTVPI